MQFSLQSRTSVVIVTFLAAVLCQSAPGQDAPGKDAQVRDADTLPPRATPGDYQAHAQAGSVTIAAEFTGHSVPTPQALLTTEDYVVVEVGLFGPPEARLKLSYEDFSLRINGKKVPSPAEAYTLVFKSLKDPDWEPPVPAEAKSKTSINTTGKGPGDSSTPAVVHPPINVERVMERRVQKSALPEGEHVLPEAGLIFFQYKGKTTGIHSLELIYAGPAGKASLTLQP
jgi:hypothetical protein